MRSILEQLWNSVVWSSHAPSDEDATLILRQIAVAGEPASIPQLMMLLFNQSAAIADAAAVAIQEIVDRCSAPELAQLDPIVRKTQDYFAQDGHRQPAAIIARGLPGVIGILSFHASGYIRESAIEAMRQYWDSGYIPFLLIRLSDWVDIVRDDATSLVVEKLSAATVPDLVLSLPILTRLSAQTRTDHQKVVDHILAFLCSPENRAELRRAIGSRDKVTRRFAFELAQQASEESLIEVLRAGLRSDDPVIRLTSVRRFRSTLTGTELLGVLETLSADASVQVRREALYGIAEQFVDHSGPHLLRALDSQHATLRRTAQFYLKRQGESDVAAHYRRRLESGGADRSTAIAGLGETGGMADATHILPMLKSGSAAVRAAAVRAIGRLGPESFDEEILAAFADRSAAVSAAARNVMLTRRHLLSADIVARFLEPAYPIHTRCRALRLTNEMSWWEAAGLLVKASETPTFRDFAIESLNRRSKNPNHLAARPNAEQLHRINSAMSSPTLLLERRLREAIDFDLAHLRKNDGPGA